MFKNTFVKLFVVVLALAMLAGCAPAATATPAAPAAPAATEAAAATTAPAAPAATTAPAASGKTYKVALVIGLLGDKSFLDSAARGIKMVNDQLKNVQTKIIENQDIGEQQLAAQAMAQQGYDMVITVGYGSADWTDKVAKDFPNTIFAIVDSTLTSPNGIGLTFKDNEGAFTVGMIAAQLTKTKKVGYIGGMDVPLLRRFELGYQEGVAYADPSVKVISGWVGDFSDPNKAKELALTQFSEGVDIIYAAAGKSGEGVITAAHDKSLFAIGTDSDQDYLQPGTVITSNMKSVDVVVFSAIKALTEGTLKGGTVVVSGLKENAEGSTFLFDSTPKDFLTKGPSDMVKILNDTAINNVKAAVKKIVAGDMCVDDYMKVWACDKPAPAGGMSK
jgi:basic membrane protein A and related proteins